MKILIVGLGSMGKRRIRNVLKLGCHDILGFDPRQDRRQDVEEKYHIDTVSSIEEAISRKPNAMIISTPPDLHFRYADLAIKHNINFFTEVNLFSKDVKIIIKKLKNKSIVGAPSCTMLYHPIVKELKRLIEKRTIGKILTVYHHFGHYLPNWHPWEDYRKFYVSKRETGGAREVVPFELVWLQHLFSGVKSVYADIDKISKLDANIDDIYELMMEFKNKVKCVLIIDVLAQPSFSETKIIGENGSILCDYNESTIKISKRNKWITKKLKTGKVAKGYKGNTSPESLYEEEIQNFLNAVDKKKKYPHPFNNELKILQVLDAAEESNKKERKITL